MADVYAAECKAFTQIFAFMTRSKARDEHQEHPIQDSPRSQEHPIQDSPTIDTDSTAVEIEVVQKEDSAANSKTDLADNTPEVLDDQFFDIESMELFLPDWPMVDQLRDEALQNLMTYQDSMKRNYDKKLRARAFKPGDWVLRTRQRSNEEPNNGKLGENWEGPFIIERLASKGSYFLKNLTGDVLTKPWNASHLRVFHK
ncbi:hypothetical protein IFM89_038950 [Coptis chinensis]|uniref:Uncharacterized protein n=1 Tax=Coptis chinensis TaxID=261450 RepID=A0A835J2H1_9MAGN|nr:hypothetical protein IFM89_038950 [Coptis chinensis]